MLKDQIIIEYILVGIVAVFLWAILPRLMGVLSEKHDCGDSHDGGWESLRHTLGYVLVYYALIIVISFVFFILNPIRVMIACRSELHAIMPVSKGIAIYLLVALPIPLPLLFLYRVVIEEYFHNKRFNTGKNAYIVNSDDYKSPKEFCEELKKRGLYFQEADEALLSSLNEKYIHQIEKWNRNNYYTKAAMLPFEEHYDDYFVDARRIDPDSEQREPAYIYNSILILPKKKERLRYAPIGRYMLCGCGTPKHSFRPFYKDYYIECKILYIDGHLYAIIGSGENYYIRQSFGEYDTPYYVLLSEEKKITTFYDGKYYPDGSIENGYLYVSSLIMHPNTREDKRRNPHVPVHYPVRVVEKIDINTINAVAKELQEGILKKSIEAHFGKGS